MTNLILGFSLISGLLACDQEVRNARPSAEYIHFQNAETVIMKDGKPYRVWGPIWIARTKPRVISLDQPPGTYQLEPAQYDQMRALQPKVSEKEFEQTILFMMLSNKIINSKKIAGIGP